MSTRTGRGRRRHGAGAGRTVVLVAVMAAVAMAAACAAPLPTPSAGQTSATRTSASPSGAAITTGATPSTPTPSTPTPSTPAATTPVPTTPAGSTTLVFSGDLLWHNSLWLSAADDHRRTGKGSTYDFDPMLASMAPVIASADLAVCHNEVPFARPGQQPAGYPAFRAPREIAAWLPTVGWDACTAASNHSLDQGFSGLVDTYSLLKQQGIQPIGTFPTEQARRTPVIVTTSEGVRVGLVSGTYGTNGIPLPKGREWSVSMWDADNLLAQAHAARAAGADIVVVGMHGGDEYVAAPNAAQRALVEKLTASSDVDLVVGEHVHVVQPITKVHGKWVVYGMGNMVAQHLSDQPRAYEGMTVRFTFAPTGEEYGVSKAEYIPTMVTRYGPGRPVRLLRISTSLDEGTGDQAALRTAQAKTRQTVHSMGGTEDLVEG